MTEHLIFRGLTKEDLDDFFSLRLEALLDSPTAFLASYDEEKNWVPPSTQNLKFQFI